MLNLSLQKYFSLVTRMLDYAPDDQVQHDKFCTIELADSSWQIRAGRFELADLGFNFFHIPYTIKSVMPSVLLSKRRLRECWVFFRRTRILSRIQFTRHSIEIVVLETFPPIGGCLIINFSLSLFRNKPIGRQ